MKPEHFDCGVNTSTMGGHQIGYSNVSITHPYTVNTGTETNSSLFEQDAYPRAIYERSIMYNEDFRYATPFT